MSEPTDSDVINASRSDPERFRLIYERHYTAVHGYLQRRVGTDLADDLAADVFVQAFGARERYDLARASAAPWLFGIATNLLRHHWRRERRQLRAFARTGVDPLTSEVEAAENRIHAARLAPVLARALASLRRGERDVLLLHVWADLSQAEVAEVLELPEGTVRSRLSRARRRMREQISASGQVTAGPTNDGIGAKSGRT